MKGVLINAVLAMIHTMGPCAVLSMAAAAEHGGVVQTTVGLEGVYYARVSGPALEAKPVDEDAPIVLRIADVVEDGNSTICELRFVGTVAGRYDLRDYLLRADGQPITGMRSMEVKIGELLPADHNGELEKVPWPVAEPRWPYRVMLAVVGALWLGPLIWVTIRRIARRQAQSVVAEIVEPSLADQLRPLVEAAVAGQLTSAEQARLELLLIAHWRKQLGLTGCSTAEALKRMRRHRQPGKLLHHLEQWLHQPPGRSNVDVAAILRPYRACPPVEENGVCPEEVAR